jgi:hypothetical protein
MRRRRPLLVFFACAASALVSLRCGQLADDGTNDAGTKHDATPGDATSDAPAGDGGADAGDGSDGASCPSGSTACGDLCVDLSNDTNHCGACGHDCEGTLCQAGACTPILVQAANPDALALQGSFLYVANADVNPQFGTILRQPKTGGQLPTLLASNQITPLALQADATHLYWTTGDRVVSMPIAGGAVTQLAKVDNGGLFALAVDAVNVYWASYGSLGEIGFVPLGGGAPTVLASGRDGAAWLVVDATYAYWSDSSGVWRIPISGGAPTQLAPLTVGGPLAVDATNLYWVNPGTAANSYTDGALLQMPLGGGSPVTLASSVVGVSSIAVDDTDVYWTQYGTQNANYMNGAVNRTPIGGGATTPVATQQQYCRDVVLDSTHLYWFDNSAGLPGTIMKLAK